MASGLEIGFLLDSRYHWLRGEMDTSKKPDLYALAHVMAAQKIGYAIIGGVALQIRQREPRTTLDIDLAVASADAIPREALGRQGFVQTGSFAHSENWQGPHGTPIQFTSDPEFASAIKRAESVPLDDLLLFVLTAEDLVKAKLRAAQDPARRRSKRIQDLADVEGLLEQDPGLEALLSPTEKALLDRLPR